GSGRTSGGTSPHLCPTLPRTSSKMTGRETESLPNPTTPATAATPTAADWDAQSEALKARFPKLPPSIVFAFHALQADPEMALGDIKAQASLHGIRVTAASVSAAERLLARNADDVEIARA